ncbi:hypothetical protein F5Y18DRAFT_322218 [Xylariaceae sp. FL1019]|nr:hypothetical protein F5Y18DRAFT_322218 [Xylariaceae sp. FL1019]
MSTRKRDSPTPLLPAQRTLRSGRVYGSTRNIIVPKHELVIEISDDGDDDGTNDDESTENHENHHDTESATETLSSTGSNAVIEISDDDDSSELSELSDLDDDVFKDLPDYDAEHPDETLPPPNRLMSSIDASSFTIASGAEHVVWSHSPIPQGYIFLRKGDTYVTRNCRIKTKKEGRDLYVVVDRVRGTKKQLGIRVPTTVYDSVVKSERESRGDRAQAVQKRDDKVEKKLRDEILHQFPKIPAADLLVVMKHATMKRSRRVGRSGKVDEVDKARLAVIAYVRHTKSNYDSILRNSNLGRHEARRSVAQTINEVLKAWGSPYTIGGLGLKRREDRDKRTNLKKTKKTSRTKAALPAISTAPARKAAIKKVKAKARGSARSHANRGLGTPETKDYNESADNAHTTQEIPPSPVDSTIPALKKAFKKARREKRKAERAKNSHQQQMKGKSNPVGKGQTS